ncbi:VapE domain-containing protein [Acinetobacter baumannii]|uniref:VapE domain-containing protein n=1 Tax=Acinetobacter baumannii TaxID=470 RepID=UPI003894952B
MSKAAYQDLSVDTIIDALGFIDPDQDRKAWARIGMAIKSELGESGFSVFDDWSKGGSKYNKADVKTTWRSIRASKGKDVTIATLIYEAQQGGFAFNDNDRVKISDEEIAARKAKREAEERKAAAEFKRIQGEVARLANLAWEAATPAYEHPYTTRKGVKINGARIGEFPVYKVEHGKPITPFKTIPALLVPIHEKKGKIVSLQAYFFEDQDYYGDRAYLKDGQKQGGYCLIGNPDKRTIAIVEGYATGLSVYEATGWAVMVAFDCGNLMNVAKIARDHFPQSEIIIAGDNDANGAGNKAAEAAGKAINARVILPSVEGQDWNDVHVCEGLESVQAQLMSHLLPKPANDNRPVNVFDLPPVATFELPDQPINSGKPHATTRNVAYVAHSLGVNIRYNVISKEVEILIPGASYSSDNSKNASFNDLMALLRKNGLPDRASDYVLNVADQNKYNPVITWITSRPWDGVSRFNDLLKTIRTRQGFDRKWLALLVRKWMLSAVAAAFMPEGFSSKGVLTFQGVQNAGKTTWVKRLVCPELRRELVKEALIVDPRDRDLVRKATTCWIGELGELNATFKRSDIAALKGFISSADDEYRRAYAVHPERIQRRTVFFASVNDERFLADETGNIRFWTVPVESLDLSHTIDTQQLWAEVYEWFKAIPHDEDAQPAWTLTKEEAKRLEESNEDFQVIDPIEERILSRLDWETDQSRWRWTNATELLIEIGIDKPTRAETIKASSCIRKRNGDQTRRSNGKNLLLAPSVISFMSDDFNRPF